MVAGSADAGLVGSAGDGNGYRINCHEIVLSYRILLHIKYCSKPRFLLQGVYVYVL